MSIFRQDRTLHEAIAVLKARIDSLETQQETAQQGLERALADMTREIDNFRLDYQGLYEKARVQLTKLARRDREESVAADDGPDLSRYRQMLAEKRLRS